MYKLNTVLTFMQGISIEQHYLPEFRKIKEVEVFESCPKCGKEYAKNTPKYCANCKTRLWVK